MIDHLSVQLDSTAMRVYESHKKVRGTRELARQLLSWAQCRHRLISAEVVRSSCGTAVSLPIALPLARFFTSSMYFYLSWVGSSIRSLHVLLCVCCARSARSRQSLGYHYMPDNPIGLFQRWNSLQQDPFRGLCIALSDAVPRGPLLKA